MRIDRQHQMLDQETQLALSKPPGIRSNKRLQEPRNRPHRDDDSSGVEDEVCGWLMEGTGANDRDRPRELSDQDRQAAGRQGSPRARAVSRIPRAMLPPPPLIPRHRWSRNLRVSSRRFPGLRSWEKVRVSLTMTLFWNLGVGFMVWSKLYGEDPAVGGAGRLAVYGSLHPDWRRHSRGVRGATHRGHQLQLDSKVVQVSTNPHEPGEPGKELNYLSKAEATVGWHTEGKRMQARDVEHRMECSVTLPIFASFRCRSRKSRRD